MAGFAGFEACSHCGADLFLIEANSKDKSNSVPSSRLPGIFWQVKCAKLAETDFSTEAAKGKISESDNVPRSEENCTEGKPGFAHFFHQVKKNIPSTQHLLAVECR